MVLHLDEIRPGLVSLLDPPVLTRFGAHTPLAGSLEIRGLHPFVCLEADDARALWAALSSSSLHGRRVLVPNEFKLGDRRWLDRSTFIYGPDNWYTGPCYAFQEASLCEFTKPYCRNQITDEGLRLVRSICQSGRTTALRRTGTCT